MLGPLAQGQVQGTIEGRLDHSERGKDMAVDDGFCDGEDRCVSEEHEDEHGSGCGLAFGARWGLNMGRIVCF